MMTLEELEQKHEMHRERGSQWRFDTLAYEGGDDFIKECIGRRNERESYRNYRQRLQEAYVFNFCEAIVDLFNFYLTQKPAIRDFGTMRLGADDRFNLFEQDCDGTLTSLTDFMNDAQRLASITGVVGLLVTKPRSPALTVSEERRYGIIPRLTAFPIQSILDWAFGPHPQSGRRVLTYLKLRNEDGQYLCWWLDRWEVYEIDRKSRLARKVDAGQNPLAEIPFVWLVNIKDVKSPWIGKGDLKNVSPIVASIVRNLSYGEEIIKWGAFPMLRKPMKTQAEIGQIEDEVGPRSVQEFNPEFGPGGKPDWMPTEILEPIEAILKWIDRKTDEIYRVLHLSGVHGQRRSNNEVASGLALRYEFQQLVSVLGKKAENLAGAEREVIRFFCAWMGIEFLISQCQVRRSKNFAIDELAAELDNVIKSIGAVNSRTYKRRAQEAIAKATLPDLSDRDVEAIQMEIGADTEKEGAAPDDAGAASGEGAMAA